MNKDLWLTWSTNCVVYLNICYFYLFEVLTGIWKEKIFNQCNAHHQKEFLAQKHTRQFIWHEKVRITNYCFLKTTDENWLNDGDTKICYIIFISTKDRNYQFWIRINNLMIILWSMFNKAWKPEIIACETLKLEI